MPTSPFTTFRDPEGSLEVRPDAAYRCVQPDAAAEILQFLGTPLASSVVAQGRLVASEILERPAESEPPAPLLLRHPRIPFLSFPWEWPPALWLSAAELTLTLAGDLLHDGWMLKDAIPLNILFQGTKPILVDVLSIRRADLHNPIWYAYAQFVRTFLLPMLAHGKLGWPLDATLTRRDGYEPEEIFAALPALARLRQPALTAVTLPALLNRSRKLRSAGLAAASPRDPALTTQVLLKTFARLHAQMKSATPTPTSSAWSDYTETASHYSSADHARKRSFVLEALAAIAPKHVLDVGCNTGDYSRLAAQGGAQVVAIDSDLATVDHLAAALRGSALPILPLRVSLASPTPAVGWENREYASFLARAAGHFDLVMMLAVLHHLLLRDQVPLDRIAALCATLTTHHLIVEWVPPTDPMFLHLLRGREVLYRHLDENAFRQAFAVHFTIHAEDLLSNGRSLFHLRKIAV